jgi:hypothetical protein
VVKHTPYVGGQYIWTGFDYLGEPTPYGFPARSSYFGIIDLAGFPKDAYYMYQSEWTTKPVLHLFPHWNWLPGQEIDLWCYYNQADEVELFVNGKSLGVRKKMRNEKLEMRNDGSSSPIKILSRVEITSDGDLAELRQYIKPLEARRMSRLMKASLLSSLKALEAAGISRPDAIITATALGCVESSEQLLRQIEEEGEVMLKPTNFMQSTHNTVSSNIAIHTRCHGYNVTYTQQERSLEWALRDAELLLRSGRCKTVLVGWHDETTPLYRSFIERLIVGQESSFLIPHNLSLVLSCSE